MHEVHLTSIDLNLLVVLEALIETRSVTATADRVGLTQSATSHALARLRSALGDPLFVRSRAGLVPTERTLALAGPLRDALDRVRSAVAPPAAFDPSTAKRRFVLRTVDYSELVLVPELVARFARSAPRIDVWISASEADPFDELARGDSDAFIGPVFPQYQRPDIRERRLFDEHFVSLVRADHPKAHDRWSLAEFAALDHALVAPRGRPGGSVDTLLEQHGLSRRIAVASPHFLVAPFIVAATDLVLTIPERVARRFAALLPLRIVEPPAAVPGFTMALMWHERRHHDAAHAWMRGEIADVAKALDTRETGREKSPRPARRAPRR
jgi:DNA-binding transcriptional LysR family regulator